MVPLCDSGSTGHVASSPGYLEYGGQGLRIEQLDHANDADLIRFVQRLSAR
jgi:hypothetical protein